MCFPVLLLPFTISSNHVNIINQNNHNCILVFTQSAFHSFRFWSAMNFLTHFCSSPTPVKFSLKTYVQRKEISSTWREVWAGMLREGQIWSNYQSLFVTVWKSLKIFLLPDNYIQYAGVLCLQNEEFCWQHIYHVL